MKFIQGQDRLQICLFPVSLDAAIDQHNEVRLIDLFVDGLNIKSLGFDIDFVDNGRPAYHPKDLLKLFIYGYMNRIRSSRSLEKETRRNIELMWLLKGLSPDHNTINNFRKDNPKAIKSVFRQTVAIASNFQLIGGVLLAGDGTRIRAQNSKKNNYNQKKIDRHLAYIDRKLSEYSAALQEADEGEKQELQDKISEKQRRKEGYLKLEEQLKESTEKQISTSDPETRQMMVRGPVSEVCYNIQSTVDAKNRIPIDYQVTNKNDAGAMGNMVRRAKTILKKNDFTVLFDKGYHKGKELDKVHKLGVRTYVAIPGVPKTSQAPNPAYNSANFQYHPATDCYTCPAGETLSSNQTWYKSKSHDYRFKQYKTPACKHCPVRADCSKSRNGKIVHRSEYQPAVERNKEFIKNNPNLYKQRAAIVEHPFGTMKRQWGFDYVITKQTMKRASADIGLVFVAYNLRRLFNLIGFERLRDILASLYSFIIALKELLDLISIIFDNLRQWLSYNGKYDSFYYSRLQSTLFNQFPYF